MASEVHVCEELSVILTCQTRHTTCNIVAVVVDDVNEAHVEVQPYN